ncbi:unnamed protein product, partial [Onchocerca flexuosa]|uniref:LTD domain-containing protein n=1 Tax=Onchocerca flexuosa TaxID=387005 RepID=A0A183HQ07_9BILA
ISWSRKREACSAPIDSWIDHAEGGRVQLVYNKAGSLLPFSDVSINS